MKPKMKLIDNLAMKLNEAEDLIEQARSLVLQVIDEGETDAEVATVDLKFDEIVDFISDIGYDCILAAQQQEKEAEEAERLAEIRVLESRLAELKARGR